MDKELQQKVVDYWDTCDPTASHIDVGNKFSSVYDKCCGGAPLENAHVVDYGCGGGGLAEYLLKHHNIRRYTGVDISSRSLAEASGRFKGNDKVSFAFHMPVTADVLFSIACIQHFPTQDYLDNFLQKVNAIPFKFIVLHFRFAFTNVFHKNPYFNKNSVIYACRTNGAYLQGKLTNYKLYDCQEIGKHFFILKMERK